ncbi:MAG: YcaO-like family protein [Parcubacteria group bacterium]|nr:YcaO-like family protein [Parcubacteria group bacterium]
MENKGEFLRAERLGDFWENYARSLGPPFSVNSFLTEFLVHIFKGTALALEKLNGQNIYVKKTDSGLDRVPPRFHSLIKYLYEEGILEQISFPKPIPDWPSVPALNLKFGKGKTASGYALNYDMAAIKAFAELIEWHSLTLYDKRNFIYGSWKELKSNGAIDPRAFRGFQVDENSRFGWAPCYSLFDNKKHFVPAQLVYLGYERLPEEPLIRQTTTNGAAAGVSREQALEHAILEAIERDALMIHWLNKITPPKIDIGGLENLGNKTIAKIIGEYRRYKIDFALLDITADLGIPVVLTVIRDNAIGRPAIFLGAGADLNIESAIIHSLLEGLRAGYWNSVSREQIEAVNKKVPLIENIEERRVYWCDKSRMREVDFLLDGPIKKIERNEFGGASNQKKMELLKQILMVRGMKAYGVDYATKAAKDSGLKITKVLIPELYYLYLDERFRYSGIKRKDVNPIPHPFL